MNTIQHNINDKSNLNLVALLYNNGYKLIISKQKELILFNKEESHNSVGVFINFINGLGIDKFESAKILINSSKNTFIPNTVYSPLIKRDLFNLNFEDTPEENIASEILSIQKLVCLFEFTNENKAKIVSKIPNAKFFNSNSILIENLMDNNIQSENIISLTGNSLDIIVKENNKLKTHCTNTINNNDELLYFLSLNIDQNNTLNYCGDFSQEVLEYLKKYYTLKPSNFKSFIQDKELTTENIIINNSFLCA